MAETTIEILTQYPFQALLMAVVLRGTLRAGLEERGGGRRRTPRSTPIDTATQAA